MRPPTTSSDEFIIRGGGDAFASRQKQMYEQLSQAAKEFNKDQSCSSLSQKEMEILRGRVVKVRTSRPLAKQHRKEMTQYRGKESIFKRPEGPAPLTACKSVPDHHKNPHKWVKYSLEDVQNNQMTDRSNAQAAFSFLRELRARRANEHDKDEDMDMESSAQGSNLTGSNHCKFTTRIPFRKTERKTNKEPSVVVIQHDDKPVFRNSKIILPEYVVGQKPEKKAKRVRPIVNIDRSRELKLDHLEELDE